MKKFFEINYKLRYHETSDWGSEIINANSKNLALKKFSLLKKIKMDNITNPQNWIWEEGVWSAEFNSITEIRGILCPHCKGEGIIYMDKNNGQ
ncbi:MAG: hypothetical protein STSR0008_23950 [Ignavibacterium sp.]